MLRPNRFATFFLFLLVALLTSSAAQAQHPTLISSIGDAVFFDQAGNAYAVIGNSLSKVRADGTIAATYPAATNVNQLAIDGAGSLYIAWFCSSSCPAPTATFGPPGPGFLVGKLGADGSSFAWLDLVTVAGFEAILKVDAAGNVYLVGSAGGAIVKIDPTGTRLIYQTSIPGANTIAGAAVDGAGSLYVTGVAGAGFTPTAGAFQTTGTPSGLAPSPGFVAKLSADGSKTYATYFNGAIASDVAVDNQGNAYITGVVDGESFPITAGSAEPVFPSWTPLDGVAVVGFAAKLNASGSGLLYCTYVGLIGLSTLGGTIQTLPPRITVDAGGNAYVGGFTVRDGAPTVDALQSQFEGPPGISFHSGDGAIAALNPQGSAYLFSSYLGGRLEDRITAISFGSDGLVHISGRTVQNVFPLLASVFPLGAVGVPFVASIRPVGSVAVPIIVPTRISSVLVTAMQSGVFEALVGSTITVSGAFELGNYGAVALAISSITTTGPFTQNNDCPASLAAGTHCLLTVTFAPTILGDQNGTVTVNSGGAAVATETLLGMGDAPLAVPTPAQLTFGVQAVGSSSAPQSITLTNSGNIPLIITSLTAQGDFSQTNDCGGDVRSPRDGTKNFCTIQVVFTPTATGQRNGSITIVSNALTSPTVIPLTGGVAPDFTVAPPAGGTTSQTINAGQSATYNLSLTPVAGFSGSVALSCSGAPQNASCAVNPASVNLSGTAATPFTVSVNTAARSATAPTLGGGFCLSGGAGRVGGCGWRRRAQCG